jgi:hypothetical protein
VNGEPTFDDEKRLIPMEAWGVKGDVHRLQSSSRATANIWRGPLASSALRRPAEL